MTINADSDRRTAAKTFNARFTRVTWRIWRANLLDALHSILFTVVECLLKK